MSSDTPVTVGMLVQLLRPLMRAAVQEALAAATPVSGKLADRLSVPEKEAAAMLGVGRHVLRDARRRGEIEASKVGSRIVYEPHALRAYLQRERYQRPGLSS